MADPRVSQEDRERIDEIAGWAYDLDEAGLGALAKMFATVRAEEREACAKAGSDAVLGIVAGAKSWLEWQRTLNREPGAAPKTTRDEVANAVAAAIRARGGKENG